MWHRINTCSWEKTFRNDLKVDQHVVAERRTTPLLYDQDSLWSFQSRMNLWVLQKSCVVLSSVQQKKRRQQHVKTPQRLFRIIPQLDTSQSCSPSFIIYNENPGLVETQKHHKLEEVQRHTYRQHQALEEERPLRSVSSGTGGGNKLRDVQRRRCGIEGSVPGGVPDLHASVFHAEVCPLSHVDE